jgi:ring-1,2-phenylacetyl-CoA epoxidase subunit PaaC
VLAAAALDRPQAAPMALVAGKAGRDGVHTEAMGYILAELQSVARAHPDATW